MKAWSEPIKLSTFATRLNGTETSVEVVEKESKIFFHFISFGSDLIFTFAAASGMRVLEVVKKKHQKWCF